MSNISLFANIRQVVPIGTLSVNDFLHNIKSGAYRQSVEYVRASETKEERKLRKEALQCVTMSGTFSKHSASNIIEHSGFICIDIDNVGSNIDDLRAELYADPFTYAGFLSASGNGLALVVRIPAEVARHKQSYEALATYYLTEYKLEIDPAPKNVSSYRYISYDSELFLNPDSNIFFAQTAKETVMPNEADNGATGISIDFVMQGVRDKHTSVASDYNDWMRMGYAIASEFGSNGWAYFNEISSYHPTYDERETRRKYDYCLKGHRSGVKIGTFWWMCKQAGIPLYPPAERKERKSPPPPKMPKAQTSTSTLSNNQYFIVLGYRKDSEQVYVFFDKISRQLIERTASALTRANLIQIAPSEYWREHFPTDKGGIAVDNASEWLITTAKRAGIFSLSKLRGRGAWKDGDNTVIHDGDKLFVNGVVTSIGDYESKYIYEAGETLGFDLKEPMGTAEAREYIALSQNIKFEREIDRHLFIGWCAIAPICGALRWRPHLWLTGKRGSGKSWILKHIVQPMLGKTALVVQGETTSAGLRQLMKTDALNPVMDEAFKEDSRDIHRVQDIISLARIASSEDGGIIAKGTVTQAGKVYLIRACFALASITDYLHQSSDRTRFAVLNIKNSFDEGQFKALKESVFKLTTRDKVARLQARTVSLMPTILQNVETFATACATHLGEQRAGDQIGTLLAGAYSLYSDQLVTPEWASEWIAKHDWITERATMEVTDEAMMLDAILDEVVIVEVGSGIRRRTIGELITIMIAPTVPLSMFPGGDDMTPTVATDALQRIGIKKKNDYVAFSNTSKALAKILQGTAWERNYDKILLRIDGAIAIQGLTFGGRRSRGVGVPASFFQDETTPPPSTAPQKWTSETIPF